MVIMADPVDQVNMNDAMLSANTITVKEEDCQDDSFIEDKVYISESGVTIDNAGLQASNWHAKTEKSEESTCLDNIKTELASFEVSDLQSDNVKVDEGISPHNIKFEFDNNGLLYCEDCEAYYQDYCIECGMLVNILNKNSTNNAVKGAQDDIPNDILEIQDCFGQIGIYALRIIPASVTFGPFTGVGTSECLWKMMAEKFVVDKNKSKYMNWMQYIKHTRNISEGNLHVFQYEGNIYYESTHHIQAGEELLVYFGEKYRNSPNEIVRMDFVTTMKDIVKDIFACTFCCLGFSSKLYLAKHKTVCVKDAARKYTMEVSELTQCPFCKIHLDPKEYFEHHMTFCCDRSGRKSILPTPPAKQQTTALNRLKRCLPQIYKCEQCKYRTKYRTELKEHTKQHYEVKIYKCGVCMRRFKTKESLRLHVESTHVYITRKDDQEHSTTDYRNTHIKVDKSKSHNQKKIFKCWLCVFRSKYKESIRRHIKTKHYQEFDFKCASCEYRTNRKSRLEVHIKNKHFKQFDYKCDKCDVKTNHKTDLQIHIKTKHLMHFDYKCNSCEYMTNRKSRLEIHIKTKHLKQFDYKCDSCEYRTNIKSNLDGHIKSKHLKEFDYKCDKCEFGTNVKERLEGHIKSKHLKQFYYGCEKCKYRTNIETDLNRHIKTKHLKQFDFKCDECEFGTNSKQNLKRHIKSKHLKQFDYKCEKCDLRTNSKTDLRKHVKSKHLKNSIINVTNVNLEQT